MEKITGFMNNELIGKVVVCGSSVLEVTSVKELELWGRSYLNPNDPIDYNLDLEDMVTTGFVVYTQEEAARVFSAFFNTKSQIDTDFFLVDTEDEDGEEVIFQLKMTRKFYDLLKIVCVVKNATLTDYIMSAVIPYMDLDLQEESLGVALGLGNISRVEFASELEEIATPV